MGSFKRNYKDVERKESNAYAGDVPKPGIYDAVLTSCKDHTSGAGNEGTEWIFEISEGPYKGWPGWVYTNDGSAAWKEMQILEAAGLLKPGSTEIDMTQEQVVKKAGAVRIKVKNEKYNEETKGKITTIMAPPGGAAAKAGSKDKKKEKATDDPF